MLVCTKIVQIIVSMNIIAISVNAENWYPATLEYSGLKSKLKDDEQKPNRNFFYHHHLPKAENTGNSSNYYHRNSEILHNIQLNKDNSLQNNPFQTYNAFNVQNVTQENYSVPTYHLNTMAYSSAPRRKLDLNMPNGANNRKIYSNKTLLDSSIFRKQKITCHECMTQESQLITSKGKPKSNRFLEILQVVQFEHSPCFSSSGLEGTCLHQYECEKAGGATMGDCADGYAVCCVMRSTCGDETAALVSWFINTEFPSPSDERLSCVVTVNKASERITQIRLDFTAFELLPPKYGTCEDDQFVVSGQNNNNVIPIICGINNGQHMYIEVGEVEGPIYFSIQTITAYKRLFAIKMTQLTPANKLSAPSGCLQHLSEAEGYLESFNYQDKSTLLMPKKPSYLNNLNYAICIQRKSSMCSITYTNTDRMQIVNYDYEGFPVIPPEQAGVEILNCPSDWLLAAATRLCGERLNDGSVLQDFALDAPVTDENAGPIIVQFRSDGAIIGRGFHIHYQQNSCSSST